MEVARPLGLWIIPLFWAGAAVAQPKSPAELLKSQVTIYRDGFGVPHILGETEQATFFGYGYAQSEDHLDRMMMQYRDAQGRRSEVLGKEALGGPLLRYHRGDYRWDGDYLQRLLRTSQAVEENRQKIDPEIYQLLDSFAQGVNYYIAQHRAALPDWIDKVTAEDVEALERSNYMRFYSIGDALSKLPGNPQHFPDLGSNQWAIASRKSANGNIMHVEHIHMPWGDRLQLYEAQLITPGKLDAGGVGWFGSPFFLAGFNRDVTWSVSYNQPNISDVYEEYINPVNSLQYLYDGHWRSVSKATASFHVQEPDGGAASTVTLPLYYTHHGPVVRFDRVHHRAYSVRLPNFDGVNYSTGMYSLMLAKNIPSFQEALARQLIPRWNFLVTDRQNLYWVHNGVVPRRNPTYNWLAPVPGWTAKTEWDGYLPFSANPQLLNPPSEFIQNANNPPWVSTKNSGINPLEPAPYYFSYPVKAGAGEEVLNSRGERLLGVLTRPKELFTLDQMVNLAFDTYVLAADVAVPLLAKAAVRHAGDEQLTQAVDQLKHWNRRAEKDSTAFTTFLYWAKAYREVVSASAFSRFASHDRGEIEIDSVREQERAWFALAEAVARLRNRFGKTEVIWGDINRVVRGGSFPVSGTGLFDVLHPDEGLEQPDGEIHCDDGWGHLMVVVEEESKKVWSLLPYGESEDPASAHYNDQTKLHSQQKLKRFWFSRADIQENTEAVWGDRNRISHLDF